MMPWIYKIPQKLYIEAIIYLYWYIIIIIYWFINHTAKKCKDVSYVNQNKQAPCASSAASGMVDIVDITAVEVPLLFTWRARPPWNKNNHTSVSYF